MEMVNHPDHYASCSAIGRPILKVLGLPESCMDLECDRALDLLNWTFNAYKYNAGKYLWRAGKKGDAVIDLQKARWNLKRCQEVFRWGQPMERAIGLIDQAIEDLKNGTIEL